MLFKFLKLFNDGGGGGDEDAAQNLANLLSNYFIDGTKNHPEATKH